MFDSFLLILNMRYLRIIKYLNYLMYKYDKK